MACLQIKGTRQEVMEMLQLFDFMNTKGLCKLEDYVELLHDVEQNKTTQTPLYIASVDVQSNDYTMQDEQNDRFVCDMLTGVYND
ncbi:Protein of unknown function [Bacillus sp. 491mf]|uniref:DUF3911 family protein n=1 Tax=Bacillus TaxID=1386 RepID=UPI00054F74F2|nr:MULTISPECIES: DUF3911 family protein [unclassified Bacillus (in: firmicutes)]SFC13206.1 Protein of unknown function [Bacillus sp. 491mf]